MTHGDDVGVAAYSVYGIAYGFSLGGRTGISLRKNQNAAAQTQHSGLEGQAGAGGRFEEQGGQLLMCTGAFFVDLCVD